MEKKKTNNNRKEKKRKDRASVNVRELHDKQDQTRTSDAYLFSLM